MADQNESGLTFLEPNIIHTEMETEYVEFIVSDILFLTWKFASASREVWLNARNLKSFGVMIFVCEHFIFTRPSTSYRH